MQRENALDTLAERDLTDRESGVASGAPANDRTFKELDPFLVTLLDPDMHAHGIARAELRQAFPHLLLVHFLKNGCHDDSLRLDLGP